MGTELEYLKGLRLVRNNKTEEALDCLSNFIEDRLPEISIEALMYALQMNKWSEQSRLGLISLKDFDMESNNVAYKTLQLISRAIKELQAQQIDLAVD